MASRNQGSFLGIWLVFLAFALLCMAIFLHGIFQYSHVIRTVIHIDLSTPTDSISVPFRVWGAGRYTLFLTSVHGADSIEPPTGAPFAGDLEVAIIAPDRKVFFQELYSAGSLAKLNHFLPGGYTQNTLGSFAFDDWPFHRWALKTRVVKPDPRFKTAYTKLDLQKDTYDQGQASLLRLLVMGPAGVFLLLAAIATFPMAVKGFMVPIMITIICSLVYLALLIA